MNKIYKLVWSKVRNTWVVASEIAKGHGKESSSGRNGKRLKLAVMTAILGGCFMTAGISPVAADLTGDQKAVYDAVMEKLNKDGVKKIHYLSIGPDNEKNLAQGGNYNNDGVEQHWGIAIGVNASSKDGDGIAMGMDSRSRGNQSIGLGSLSSAVGTYSTAVGHRSQAFGYSASAYGALARAYGANGVALGAGALVSNSKGLTKAEYDALPEEEKALYHTEIKQDDYYQYKQKTDSGKIEDIEVNGVAIGNYASSIGFGGVAIGDRAKASDKDNIENSKWGVALGASSQNKVDQGVALGASSVADRANNVKGYLPTTGKSIKYFEDAMEATGKAEAFNQFKKDYVAATAKLNEAKTAYEANTTDDTLKAAFEEAKKKVEDLKGQYAVMTAPWTSRRGAVSVGNDKTGFTRQITGVAAGSEDTDAVNVAQLKAVNKKVDKGAIHYVSVKPIDQSQAAGFNYLNDGAKGDGGIAIGQNAASQGRGIAIGYKSNATPKEGATLNLNSFEGIAIGQEAHMEVPGGIALGLRSKVEGTLNTQDGNVNEQGTVALGTDAYAKGNGAAAFGWKAKGIGEGAMAFGTETKAKESGTAFGGHANAAAGAVAMGWQANANDFVATSVGTSSDAGKQATAVGAAASATGRASTAVGLGSTSKGLQSTTIGALSVAEENGSVALGAGAVANTKAGAVGYIATGGSATFEEALATLDKKEDYDKWTATVNASKAEYDNLTKAFKDAPKGKKDEAKQALDEWKDKHADFIEALTAKEKLEATWRATKAAVSVGADGVDKAGNKIIESRQITNVAAGTQDTDAVNVAQLKALNTKVDQGAIHYFSVNSDDKNTPDGTNWKNDGATGNDAVAAGRYAKAYGNQSQATGRNAWSIGDYSQASGYNAVAAAEKGIDAAAYNALSEEEKENYKLNTQSEGTKNTSLYYRTKFKEYTNDEFNALSAMEQHRLTNEKGYRYDKEKEVWTLAPGAVAIGHAAKAIGLSTLAVGDLAEATSKYAVAVGREAEATDVGNTALGYYAKAKGLRSTALGVATRATDFESMAVGPYARAEGKVSLALGSNAHAKGNNSIAMGRRSESTGESSIALGGSAKTQAQGSVAIGMMAESRQKGSVALGEASLADREAGVWGRDISTGEAMNEDTLLVAGKADYKAAKAKLTELRGQAETLRNDYQASLAKDPVAPNGNHIPSAATRDIGNKLRAKEGEVFAQTIQVNNFVKAWKATQSAISIGNKEKGLTRQITGLAAGTEDTDAVNVAQLKALNTKVDQGAIHYFSVKSDDSAKPAGTNWNNDGATGQDAIAIGKNAVSEGQDAIAIGKNAVSDRQESTAIGSQAQAYQYYSTAIGSTAIAGSHYSTALGYGAQADLNRSTAIGSTAIAGGHYSTALGYGAQADWTYSTALGGNADAQGLHSTALGGIAKAQGHYSTVLGYKAEALADGSVALGNDAVAGREAGTVGYFASASGTTLDDVLTALDKKTDYDNWTATINASKAEYERLTNAYFNASESDKAAAKAALDTWKEQHKAFVKALEERTRLEATWKASRGAVSVGADGFDEAGNTIIESRQITNVAAGTEDTDAVNVAQLKVVNEKADKNATDITNLTKTVNANGKATIVKVDGKEESTDGNLKITKKTENGQTTYDLSLSDEITIGKDGKDGKIGINGKDGASAEITVGKGEPGVDGKDGETITRIIYTDKDGKEHKVATLDDGLKFKGDNDTVVTRKLNTQLNITGGITDKAELSNNNIGVVGTQDGGMAIKLSKKLKGLTSAEFVDGDKVTNITAQTITQKDGDNITNITGGNVTITRKEGNVDLWELNKTVNNITQGTTDVSSWKLQANGENERTIKKGSVVNFKNGQNTEVTVNGDDITVDLNADTKKQIKDNTTNITNIDKRVTSIENNIDQKIEGAKITVQGDKDTGVKATEVKNGDKVTGYKVSLEKKVKVGNVTIDGTDKKGEITGLTNTTVEAADFATKGRAATEEQLKAAMDKAVAQGTTTVKAGDKNISVVKTENKNEYTVGLAKDITVNSVTAKTVKADEYKVGDKTYINKDGINANGNKITNVGDGVVSKESTDAVNGKQLFATNQMIANNMNQINNLREESREGDAMGSAMAALKPLDFDPYQRNQVMAGVGYYRGKEAVALGLAHYKNEDLMIHGGLAYAGNSELMANVGVSYRFGSSENREAKKARNLRMPQYDKGPISSVYILQDEVERLTKENKEANDRIAALEAKLEKVLEKVK